MPRPVCINCSQSMRQVENGVNVAFGAKILDNNEKKPYQIWQGDGFRCDTCGAEVVCNFALRPIHEHFKGPPDVKTVAFIPEV